MAVERRIDVIDVTAVLRRQVIVLDHSSRCVARVETLRLKIPIDIPIEHLSQRVEHAVVEEDPPRGDIAQARRQEHAAVAGLGL